MKATHINTNTVTGEQTNVGFITVKHKINARLIETAIVSLEQVSEKVNKKNVIEEIKHYLGAYGSEVPWPEDVTEGITGATALKGKELFPDFYEEIKG